MSNDNAITSVIIASASAVGKVFVIGTIGYISAIRPRKSPILPRFAMDSISKMNFNLLILPLIYSTLASAVTLETLGSLWFVLVAAIFVICLSYTVATLLEKLPFFSVENRIDFDALRVAAAFPNIVALPILIFPALCEHSVVFNSFYDGSENNDLTDAQKFKSCVDQSNAMIFIYFFGWNLLYWIIGFPTLVAAGEKRQSMSVAVISPQVLSDTFKSEENDNDNNEENDNDLQIHCNRASDSKEQKPAQDSGDEQIIQSKRAELKKKIKHVARLFATALIQTLKSPGFISMMLGFITACIQPLSNALFSQGGALRFLGSALESLGRASSSVGTLVVAASLVHQASDTTQSETIENEHSALAATELGVPLSDDNTTNNTRRRARGEESSPDQQHSNLRSSMRRKRSSISQLSMRAMTAIQTRKPTIKMHSWFICSRLIISPAIVCLLIVAMDCGGVLDRIDGPSLAMAKMVIIVNAGLPGAQLIILTLKSKGLSESASIVARVYLPSYILSIITIAAWSSIGLMISVPREDGTPFCKR